MSRSRSLICLIFKVGILCLVLIHATEGRGGGRGGGGRSGGSRGSGRRSGGGGGWGLSLGGLLGWSSGGHGSFEDEPDWPEITIPPPTAEEIKERKENEEFWNYLMDGSVQRLFQADMDHILNNINDLPKQAEYLQSTHFFEGTDGFMKRLRNLDASSTVAAITDDAGASLESLTTKRPTDDDGEQRISTNGDKESSSSSERVNTFH